MFGGSFAWHFKKGLRGLKFGIWSSDFSGQGFNFTVDFDRNTNLGPNLGPKGYCTKKDRTQKLNSGHEWTKLKTGPKINLIQSYGQIEIMAIRENDQYLQVVDQCNSQFEIVSGKSRNMSNLAGRPRTTKTDTDNYKFDFHSG